MTLQIIIHMYAFIVYCVVVKTLKRKKIIDRPLKCRKSRVVYTGEVSTQIILFQRIKNSVLIC